jgi:hypothetical protein
MKKKMVKSLVSAAKFAGTVVVLVAVVPPVMLAWSLCAGGGDIKSS